MRYFFFTYISKNNAYSADGNCFLESEKFPSNEQIKSIAEARNPGTTAVITWWNEFKSKEDYDAFYGS